MRRTMLGGKIHRATVTEACVDYEGSISLDTALLEAAGILPNEQVHVWDVANGARFTTYAIPARAGSGACCVNGAAARLVSPGDLVIVAAFVELEDAEARAWEPRIAFIDERNRVVTTPAEDAFRGAEEPGAARRG
ncbi:MAG TPA: aspartate 1-decarboxylase [Coriobacteriia bacterium]|jgi:aspartate 1-decarboxylase